MRLINLENNIFVFVLLELVILCESYNNETIKQTAGKLLNRQKRYIEPLKIKIKDGNVITELLLANTDQRVAGKFVPVWHAFPLRDKNKDNVEYIERFQDFDALGDFTAYHDIDHSAAFVHFSDMDELYGVIDTRYFVKKLPFRIAQTTVHEAGGPYIQKRPRDQAGHTRRFDFHDPIGPISLEKTWLSMINGTKSRRVRRDTSYDPQQEYAFFEILVLATHDTLINIEGEIVLFDIKPYLAFLKYIVAYFNAVDLLFARFGQPSIQINIAGIVIERVEDTFPFVKPFKLKPPKHRNKRLNVDAVMKGITHHFTNFQQNTFTCDSFDAIMFLTTYDLIEPPDFYVEGITLYPPDAYNERLLRNCASYKSVMAVTFESDFQDFICAAHEIGHSLHVIEHDKDKPNPEPGQKCQLNIMKASGSNCPECLTWSKRSVKAFIKYFSSKSCCHLLNYPRSLSPNRPKRLLTRTMLCRCFKSQYSVPTVVLEDICSARFTCVSSGIFKPTKSSHPEPFDGTPCGPKDVCWNRQCQKAAPFIPSLDNYIEETPR